MISAIIVNYHCYELTVRAAASVLADQSNAQVIVVDNSVDPSQSKALQALLPVEVKFIISSENIGFGRACNLALRDAKHEWVFLLNPDAYVLKGCLSTLVDFLENRPQAGAVAPLAYWNKERTWLLPPGQLLTPARELGLWLALHWPWLGKKVGVAFSRWALRCHLSDQAVSQAMLSGGHVLLRRSALDAVGGLFDADFFMYFEDMDLCLRLRKSGFDLYYLPAAQVVHEWSATASKNEHSGVSSQIYFNKHFKGSWLLSLRESLKRLSLPVRSTKADYLGSCSVPPIFPICPSLQKGWLLELSPNPLLVPAIHHFGEGVECVIPEALWQRLGEGRYWVRIGTRDNKDCQYFCWEKSAIGRD